MDVWLSVDRDVVTSADWYDAEDEKTGVLASRETRRQTMLGWHFTGDTLRDGSPIPAIGEWLSVDGDIKPCVRGLHASEHPFNALLYAPGPILHRVELEGDLVPHGNPTDKYVGRSRKILKSHDATTLLRRFACDQALAVLPDEAPQIIREYLTTTDATKRVAAWDAAKAATKRDAAWDAAVDAARAASASAATWAAWNAARSAARSAARDAAWLATARDDFGSRVNRLFGVD